MYYHILHKKGYSSICICGSTFIWSFMKPRAQDFSQIFSNLGCGWCTVNEFVVGHCFLLLGDTHGLWLLSQQNYTSPPRSKILRKDHWWHPPKIRLQECFENDSPISARIMMNHVCVLRIGKECNVRCIGNSSHAQLIALSYSVEAAPASWQLPRLGGPATNL